MKKNLFLIFGVLAVVIVAGCNTMRGAGKDVEKAGTGIQNIVNHND